MGHFEWPEGGALIMAGDIVHITLIVFNLNKLFK